MAAERPPRAATLARREALVQRLAGADPVDVDALADEFGVSPSTIRRDLASLERGGHVLRVLGGAVKRPLDASWHEKAERQADVKRRLAARACELVAPDSLVFLDAGTTVAAMAGTLATRADLTVATVGLPSLFTMADGAAQIIVLGGRLDRRGGRLLGALTEQILSLIRPDIAFLGADSLDPVHGVNCPDAETAAIKMRVMAMSATSWVLADRTKLTGVHRHRYWAPLPRNVGLVVERMGSAQRGVVDALARRGHRIIEV